MKTPRQEIEITGLLTFIKVWWLYILLKDTWFYNSLAYMILIQTGFVIFGMIRVINELCI